MHLHLLWLWSNILESEMPSFSFREDDIKLISVMKMIWVINSIPWVRCASGNVLYIFPERSFQLWWITRPCTTVWEYPLFNTDKQLTTVWLPFDYWLARGCFGRDCEARATTGKAARQGRGGGDEATEAEALRSADTGQHGNAGEPDTNSATSNHWCWHWRRRRIVFAALIYNIIHAAIQL